jgi:hypothetical protein
MLDTKDSRGCEKYGLADLYYSIIFMALTALQIFFSH